MCYLKFFLGALFFGVTFLWFILYLLLHSFILNRFTKKILTKISFLQVHGYFMNVLNDFSNGWYSQLGPTFSPPSPSTPCCGRRRGGLLGSWRRRSLSSCSQSWGCTKGSGQSVHPRSQRNVATYEPLCAY